ncbi:hypothetical protein SLS62_007364 [Diatrype stigma]|uniref:Uncharacterized protein n=1 Tax=Diatrype stigma TaxID=117547 RepID=A0AAN9YQS2_9PEZI
MFGTLRIGHDNSEAQFIDRTGSILGDAAMQRIACDFCRAKKSRHTEAHQQTWHLDLEKGNRETQEHPSHGNIEA